MLKKSCRDSKGSFRKRRAEVQCVPPQQTGTGTVPVVALGTRSRVTFAE